MTSLAPAEVIAIAIGALSLLVIVTKVLRAVGRFLQKTSHFIDDVTGETERPGVPGRPGVVEQVTELRVRQEEIAAIAQESAAEVLRVRVRQEEIAVVAETAAADVAAVRLELTRNGGESTKDAVHQAERSAESAAAEARKASEASRRTEDLVRAHLANGEHIMEVGVHNDAVMLENQRRLAAAVGIELRDDYREYPNVDHGGDGHSQPRAV